MKIKRETDYAIRAVLCLSRHSSEVMGIDEIAKEMSIPSYFLAKILQKLAQAGIVSSERGAFGGFRLSMSPSDVTLLSVVLAIEGSVAMNECAINEKNCDMSNGCTVHPVWLELRDMIEDKLSSYSFKQLLAS